MKRRGWIRQSLTLGASLGASLVSSPALTACGGRPVGGTWVDSAAGDSSARLRVRVRGRVRVRTMPPMDTGLVGGIPAIFVSKLALRDGANLALLLIQTFEPVSENPEFSFEFAKAPTGPLRIVGVDNNGNRIDSRVE